MTSRPYLSHEKLLDLLLDVVCVVDIEGRFLSVSATSEGVFGYGPEEMVGRTSFELMHPDDREATRAMAERINSGKPSGDHENRYLHKDGHIVHIMWSTQWLEAEQVRVGVARDITLRKRTEAQQAALYTIAQAAHSAENLQSLYAQVHQVIGQLLPAENFFVALYDAASDELSFPYYTNQLHAPPTPQPLTSDNLIAEVIRSGESLLLTPDTARQVDAMLGTREEHHCLSWLGVPLISSAGTLGALVLQNYADAGGYSEQDRKLLQFAANQVATAIERKRAHSRLEFLALYDQLTELPNRALLLDRLQGAVQRAQRNTLQLAVLYLDMDNFKQINDTYGHTTGDQLLQEAAHRLRQCIRGSDTVGRLGGDEFAIVLENINSYEDATSVAESILVTLSAPYILNGRALLSSPSVGIAAYPEHGQAEQQLLQLADEAMYVAKRNGGKGYSIAGRPSVAD